MWQNYGMHTRELETPANNLCRFCSCACPVLRYFIHFLTYNLLLYAQVSVNTAGRYCDPDCVPQNR